MLMDENTLPHFCFTIYITWTGDTVFCLLLVLLGPKAYEFGMHPFSTFAVECLGRKNLYI